MFNKNHYVYLAKSLKDSKPTDDWGIDVWKRSVHLIAHDLGVDNRRFNKARFYLDCGAIEKSKEKS